MSTSHFRPVVAIVQARMGSVRFPGKMMAEFLGAPLIEWVLRRLQRAESIDTLVLATSNKVADDALATVGERLGVEIFRGDETDVLGRFVAAGHRNRATTAVRICADNPFVAPEAIDLLVDSFSRSDAEYGFNHMGTSKNAFARSRWHCCCTPAS